METYIYSPVKYRHELKHHISFKEAMILEHRFQYLFLKDIYGDEHGQYEVHSLYFDTLDDEALKDKIYGLNHKEKFRIRYYNNNTNFIRLEKKMKKNGLCAKRQTKLTQDQVISIINGDIDFLLKSHDPLMIEFYTKLKNKCLRPVVIVSYIRQAFCFKAGNVRITIDKDLCVEHNIHHFFDLKHKRKVNDQIILEVKYDEFLPDIVSMAVNDIANQTQTYSKFERCRQTFI